MIKILFLIIILTSLNVFSKTLQDSTEFSKVLPDTAEPSKILHEKTAIADTVNEADTIEAVVPAGKTAKDVIDNYIRAIGNADKFYSIVDRTTVMRGTVQGINITIVSYQKAPNKLKQEIKAGSSEQLIIFDGEKGMMELAGEKKEITGAELEKLKFESTLTLLTDPEHYGIKLELDEIEIVDGKNAYKIIMTLPSGIRWTQYYNVESGLKVKEEKNISAPMGLFQQIIKFDDYKEVEGMLYPFKIEQTIGSQNMDFTVSSIKINTGLIDREFEIE